jgi:hypothetical protein
MFRMCIYMYSRFVENQLIRILKDVPLVSKRVLKRTPPSHGCSPSVPACLPGIGGRLAIAMDGGWGLE